MAKSRLCIGASRSSSAVRVIGLAALPYVLSLHTTTPPIYKCRPWKDSAEMNTLRKKLLSSPYFLLANLMPEARWLAYLDTLQRVCAIPKEPLPMTAYNFLASSTAEAGWQTTPIGEVLTFRGQKKADAKKRFVAVPMTDQESDFALNTAARHKLFAALGWQSKSSTFCHRGSSANEISPTECEELLVAVRAWRIGIKAHELRDDDDNGELNLYEVLKGALRGAGPDASVMKRLEGERLGQDHKSVLSILPTFMVNSNKGKSWRRLGRMKGIPVVKEEAKTTKEEAPLITEPNLDDTDLRKADESSVSSESGEQRICRVSIIGELQPSGPSPLAQGIEDALTSAAVQTSMANEEPSDQTIQGSTIQADVSEESNT